MTRPKWKRLALPVALLMTLVAAPAIAGVTWGYNRNQELVGATRSGNPSWYLGTRSGTNKVFRFDSNNDSYPEMILMLARGSVTNQSRRTQQFFNVGTWINDMYGYYPAQTDIATVLGFLVKDYGYNITVATWRGNRPQEPTAEVQ